LEVAGVFFPLYDAGGGELAEFDLAFALFIDPNAVGHAQAFEKYVKVV
jgi:hypothetical protein